MVPPARQIWWKTHRNIVIFAMFQRCSWNQGTSSGPNTKQNTTISLHLQCSAGMYGTSRASNPISEIGALAAPSHPWLSAAIRGLSARHGPKHSNFLASDWNPRGHTASPHPHALIRHYITRGGCSWYLQCIKYDGKHKYIVIFAMFPNYSWYRQLLSQLLSLGLETLKTIMSLWSRTQALKLDFMTPPQSTLEFRARDS